ncbi:MAG: hypothetical protein LWW86_15260 [Micrococcales bacterium]|nr:hypothetical protein [Micrococcales bacterium]
MVTDPDTIRALARRADDLADALSESARTVLALENIDWSSPAARAFIRRLDSRVASLRRFAARAEGLADLLRRHATALEDKAIGEQAELMAGRAGGGEVA